MLDELLEGNRRFLKRIGRSDLNGQKSIRTGRTSNGMRSFRVMGRGHNQADIQSSILLAKSGKKKSILRTVYKHGTKGRLDGCFGGQ